MRNLTIPLLLSLLLAACASKPTSQDTSTASTPSASDTPAVSSSAPEWQVRRASYMDCATAKAKTMVDSRDTSKAVAHAAVKSCDSELATVRTSFQRYFESQMVSSHGKSGARRAADQVARDTERKTETHLEQYVEYARYQGKKR